MSLEPSIKQMLLMGQSCSLRSLDEAYDNYMNHYDCFFLISDYQAQYAKFIKDLTAVGLVEVDELGRKHLTDVSIADALDKLNE